MGRSFDLVYLAPSPFVTEKTRPMKTLFTISLLAAALYLNAQASVSIEENTTITCADAPHIVLSNLDWNNAGFLADPAESTLYLTGNGGSILTFNDEHFNEYHDIVLDNNGEDVVTHSDINLSGNLYLWDANLNLDGRGVFFLSPYGRLLEEGASNYVYDYDYGHLSAGQLLNSPEGEDPGYLGLSITGSANYGYSQIYRGHNIQSTPTGLSASRWYYVYTINDQDAQLRFHYFPHELNGMDANQMVIWQSLDHGLTWQEVETYNRNTTEYWVEAYVPNVAGMYTLAMPEGSFAPNAPTVEQSTTRPSEETMGLAAYPTLWSNELNMRLTAAQEEALTLNWVDALGRVAHTEQVTAYEGEQTFSYSLSHLPVGAYFIQVQEWQVSPLKVIKAN